MRQAASCFHPSSGWLFTCASGTCLTAHRLYKRLRSSKDRLQVSRHMKSACPLHLLLKKQRPQLLGKPQWSRPWPKTDHKTLHRAPEICFPPPSPSSLLPRKSTYPICRPRSWSASWAPEAAKALHFSYFIASSLSFTSFSSLPQHETAKKTSRHPWQLEAPSVSRARSLFWALRGLLLFAHGLLELLHQGSLAHRFRILLRYGFPSLSPIL